MGTLKIIDVVAASAELGVAKPDRAIFDKALEMAECQPDYIVDNLLELKQIFK